MQINKINSLKGELTVPGDKSISHRAVMLGSISDGETEIKNFLKGADCLSTIRCFRDLGINISINEDTVLVQGKGMHGLKKPENILDVGNSGTTIRLICGILAAQNFSCMITGDDSIRKRPMKRIIEPLTLMGADIKSLSGNGYAPLSLTGNRLKGINYHSKIASAQMKSSVLLAGLYAEGKTRFVEPHLSRNHTELMLNYFGADVVSEENTHTVFPAGKLTGRKVEVPGDISSAAFFMAAALITPNSEVLIKNVGINHTRSGIIKIIKNMGGNLSILNKKTDGPEETADILVKSSSLKGMTIEGEIIPNIIDEIPIIAVMAAFADGTTIIKDAAELKLKESNRIDAMVDNLSKMGADITATEDGMIINGGLPLKGAEIDSHHDHRIAMSFAIAGLNAENETKILGSESIKISYPSFFDNLYSLI
jgi:3-phosphoshikimate 1-carboxyvinyltransferase